uniref:hypothetical protein n=1 Tax=Pedobacter schmidteae TaxID=2201271 RepID=UPI000EB4F5DE|nr:hypothetical protein [Pedobacter schmidteae]
MIENKNKLIERYLLPAFNAVTVKQKDFFASLCKVCRLEHTSKFQQLEIPGPAEGGRMWFAIDALVHAFYYCPVKCLKRGSRIWKKREFILYSASLMQQEPLTDYIEVLEPGRVLSIGYTELAELQLLYPQLNEHLQDIGRGNERYYHHRNQLLNKPIELRIAQFKEENPLFVLVVSHATAASHLGMALRTYVFYLAKGK